MRSNSVLAGHELSSGLVAAAGFQNGIEKAVIVEKFNYLLKSEVDVITLGSFTVVPNEGNEIKFGPPVYYYDAKKGKTYNSMGLANIGVDEAVTLIEQLMPAAKANKKLVIASGSPLGGAEYGTSVEQAVQLAEKLLKTPADLVELNLSCPNVVTGEGGRKPIMGYDLQSIEELLTELSKRGGMDRIGLKLPPYLSNEEKALIPRIAELLNKYPVGFLTICNTIPNQIPMDEKGAPILSVPGGMGGMSGPATKAEGREQLRLWKTALPDIDIISLLGVDSDEEKELRAKMGAAAVGGVTFIREELSLKA